MSEINEFLKVGTDMRSVADRFVTMIDRKYKDVVLARLRRGWCPADLDDAWQQVLITLFARRRDGWTPPWPSKERAFLWLRKAVIKNAQYVRWQRDPIEADFGRDAFLTKLVETRDQLEREGEWMSVSQASEILGTLRGGLQRVGKRSKKSKLCVLARCLVENGEQAEYDLSRVRETYEAEVGPVSDVRFRGTLRDARTALWGVLLEDGLVQGDRPSLEVVAGGHRRGRGRAVAG